MNDLSLLKDNELLSELGRRMDRNPNLFLSLMTSYHLFMMNKINTSQQRTYVNNSAGLHIVKEDNEIMDIQSGPETIGE